MRKDIFVKMLKDALNLNRKSRREIKSAIKYLNLALKHLKKANTIVADYYYEHLQEDIKDLERHLRQLKIRANRIKRELQK